MDKVEVRFEPWLRRAFELYRDNFALLLLAHVVAVAVSLFTFGVLAGPMAAGVIRITLDLLDGREPKPQAGDIFRGFDHFLPMTLLALAGGLAGLVLGILLAPLGPLALAGPIVLATITFYAPFIIIERNAEFWPAVQASWMLARSNFWPLLGLVAFGLLVGLAGGLVLVAGMAFTLPFYTCLSAIAWRHAAGEPEPTPEFTRLPAPPWR